MLNSSVYQRVFQYKGGVQDNVKEAPGGECSPMSGTVISSVLTPGGGLSGIKTNKSFKMKYAKNQQELTRRRRLEGSYHLADNLIQSTLSGTVTLNGPYRL